MMIPEKHRITGFAVVLISLFLMGNSLIMAQDQTAGGEIEDPLKIQEQSPNLSQKGFGSMVLKTLFTLVIVIAIMVLGMIGLKSVAYRKKGGALSMRVLGSTMLGPKKGIYLVEVESRRLLLGVTDASISFLTELEKGEQADDSPYSAGTDAHPSMNRFRDFLDSLLKKRGEDG